MDTAPNKPIALRQVTRDPVTPPKDGQRTGIIFECELETRCPHCNAVVPLANATPLSNLLCPTCSGKILVPGRVGGFLLHEHIGEGEMGAIYRATDESLNREVAVKLVRGCLGDDPESLERLRREACAAGRLNHPRVAQVYALNFSNRHPYLVMELVTGLDFARKLEQEGHIEEHVALRMALDVADGLSALHREGLVHGDIKPANIVLDRDGNAKLVDFGLSGMTRRDRYGNFVGTPNYIAPELLRGDADTHRSDIYSLGATLYHLLSGRLPHDGETPTDILKAKLWKHPVPLGKHARHVSSLTQKLVMKMLDVNPLKRHANSDAVAADIRAALAFLDRRPPANPGATARLRRLIQHLSMRRRQPQHAPHPRRRTHLIAVVILGLIAVIAVLRAVKDPSFNLEVEELRQKTNDYMKAMAAKDGSFDQTKEWFRRQVDVIKARFSPPPIKQPERAEPARKAAGQIRTKVSSVTHPQMKIGGSVSAPKNAVPNDSEARLAPPPQPETKGSGRDAFTTEAQLNWQSINLGENSHSGSTLQRGGTMIVQGAGTDMWQGYDRCRFVYTKASDNYAFSAQITAIADNSGYAISGLLVKGDEPSLGPGLLFGFLGSGELFLQIRQPDNTAVLVKRSERPIRLPSFLKLIRHGKTFDACVSADNRTWDLFSSCELDLPSDNTVGCTVSAHVTNTLATAQFANIRLLKPSLPGAGKPSAPR